MSASHHAAADNYGKHAAPTQPVGTATAVSESANPVPHNAGAFDIRNIIGGLLGIYGIFMLISYVAIDPGIDITTGEPKDAIYNLYAGIVLLLVAAGFFVWTKLAPITIDE